MLVIKAKPITQNGNIKLLHKKYLLINENNILQIIHFFKDIYN